MAYANKSKNATSYTEKNKRRDITLDEATHTFTSAKTPWDEYKATAYANKSKIATNYSNKSKN